ncbi:CobW family GTP-binding protein [Paraclostridium sordellii]|uniref:CobW family GTP-binding protein n=1 Tax=Paraclostridium sordellii TaxID=1505 RepID=UPI0005EA16A6|nr:CobW family GTP-binding protein [Paeniclostridium sordellii]CEP43195.1 CobW/P47K family protein [[Clostridium] sordellii] [Paeniclostridium sordellii]CEQ17171.1 CobW/P47K family protein [[Clostridium] sordellii] [Paeniclostridium sordellii]
MIKIDVVSGFLGSGKTTLIKHMLESIENEKVVIIENEFGQIGIDGDLISKSGIDVLELQNGCICCSIKLNFRDTLLDIIEKFNPDRILIEPTGIGLLSEIISMIGNLKLKNTLSINSLITVVDGLNYFDYIDNFGDFFEDQIKNASILMISKTQLIGKDELNKVELSLKNLNKTANIINKDWDKIPFDNFFEKLDLLNCKISDDIRTLITKGISEDMKNIESISKIPNKIYTVESLEYILSSLNNEKLGKIIRCKGFVNNDEGILEFNYINGNYTIASTNRDITPKLCIIGTNLAKEELLNMFK